MTASSAPLLLTPAGRQDLLACYRDGLLNDTIPFWFPRCVDAGQGGFLHCLDRDGTIVDTDKGVWVQGRMTWMLLALYNTVRRDERFLEWARSGLQFLERHGFDADGRMFFHLTREGRPIRKRRYAYSESFMAISYAAHARAAGEDRSARRAVEMLDHFVRWNFTPGLMPPKFTDVRPMTSIGPRMIALITAQELRANLGDSPHLRGIVDRCLDDIVRLFVKPDRQVVMENVAPDGSIVDHFDGRLLNPGHALECAWFVLAEGKHRRDASLVALGCDMIDWMWRRGWDSQYGGLLYFRDVDDKPVQEYWQDMKFWWPHNETIIATLLAYLLTGRDPYARMHQQVHDWAYRHFADPQFGEWYGYLHRDGRVSTPLKGNLWKSFFHHPRMQWLCWQLLEEQAQAGRRDDA